MHTQMHTHCSNFHITQRGGVDNHIGNTEQVAPGNAPQVGGGGVKQSLTQFELLHCEVEVVAIGELILGGGDTGALLDPVRVWVWAGGCGVSVGVADQATVFTCKCEYLGKV